MANQVNPNYVFAGEEVIDFDALCLTAQTRTKNNDTIIQEYAKEIRQGAEFPLPVAFIDKNDRFILADGYHRIEAMKVNGHKSSKFLTYYGDDSDALAYNIDANIKTGLRMTTADKRNAVVKALKDEILSQKSDRELSKLCLVDHKTVGKYRAMIKDGKDPLAPKKAAGETVNDTSEGSDSDVNDSPKNDAPKVDWKAKCKELEEELTKVKNEQNALIERARGYVQALENKENLIKMLEQKVNSFVPKDLVTNVTKLIHPDLFEKALNSKHKDLLNNLNDALKIINELR